MSTEQAQELKPCPFCGGEAVKSTCKDESLWSHDIVFKTSVHCGECEIATLYTEPGCEFEAVDQSTALGLGLRTRGFGSSSSSAPTASPRPLPTDSQSRRWLR